MMTPHRKKCPHVVHFNISCDWFEINSQHQKRYSEGGKKNSWVSRSTGKSNTKLSNKTGCTCYCNKCLYPVFSSYIAKCNFVYYIHCTCMLFRVSTSNLYTPRLTLGTLRRRYQESFHLLGDPTLPCTLIDLGPSAR